MWRQGLLSVLFLIPLTFDVFGQPESPAKSGANRRVAESQRREWVRTQITKLVPPSEERAAILAQLNELPDDQVQALALICLDELESQRKQLLGVLREANARERAFREELERNLPPRTGFEGTPGFYGYPGYYAPTVGYIPVITWLPEGASLTAQAVVSPDRRHVRLSVVPFFSSIGPVYTFNYMTGETRRYDP